MKDPITLTDKHVCISLEHLEQLDEKQKAKILQAIVPGELLARFITSLVADTTTRSQLQYELDIDYDLWSYTTDSLRSKLQPLLEPMFREECETLRRITKNSEALRSAAGTVANLLSAPLSAFWINQFIDGLHEMAQAYGSFRGPVPSRPDFAATVRYAFAEYERQQQLKDEDR